MFDIYKDEIGALTSILFKKRLLATKFTGTPSAEIFDPTRAFTSSDTIVMQKPAGKEFVILNITDPHFSDYDMPRKESNWDGERRRTEAKPAAENIKKLVALVKPDLITVTGDMVCYATRYAIDRFTKLMDSFGIPWAPIFGNHDREANCDGDFLAERMMRSKTCLFRKGPASLGNGNYVICVKEGENVIGSLLMTDTSGPREALAAWTTWAAEGVQALAPQAPVALFGHKPHEQFAVAYNEAWDAEEQCFKDPTQNHGERHEDECPWGYELYRTIRDAGIGYCFCGHDHVNNYAVTYNGMRLTYMLKMGKGSGYRDDLMGGTVITLRGDGQFHAAHQYMGCRNNTAEPLF